MYELVCGSIFDKKCDLIVIPCNNIGGVTNGIRRSLIVNNIPFFKKNMSPGEIYFKDNVGDFTNASVIGFAASVNVLKVKCETDYLHHISKEIISYCKANSIHLVNIPLLGSGAGGLTPKTSFEILKAHFEKNNSLTVRIFAYSTQIYSELAMIDKKAGQTNIKNPRVFISYAGKDPENKKWVETLAYKLRENGIDAHADFFHLKRGQDLAQWMTNEIIMADKILLICDKHYVEKADFRNGGVGWETMIIQGDMMSNTQTDKYICICREKNIDESLPIYVKSKYYLHWTEPEVSEKDFKELIYNLFDCDLVPDLGDIPDFIREKLNKK